MQHFPKQLCCFIKTLNCSIRHFSHQMLVIGCNPPDLHRGRFDGVRHSALSPGVPQDVHPLALVLLFVFWRAIEVCHSALVEPPSCLVMLNAAALHRAVPDRAERIAAVIVHVRGAKWSCVLVLLLVVASEGVACTRTDRQASKGVKQEIRLFIYSFRLD